MPPIRYTLEQAMEFIADDELVEVTPRQIRLRKRALKEHERKRAGTRGRERRGPERSAQLCATSSRKQASATALRLVGKDTSSC